ncbi:hypothetical protein BDL97_04G039600 [Sphagnum fallax]|nr:hypothetical protein BDL97_04G039600 [Sphagnum fallax]
MKERGEEARDPEEKKPEASHDNTDSKHPDPTDRRRHRRECESQKNKRKKRDWKLKKRLKTSTNAASERASKRARKRRKWMTKKCSDDVGAGTCVSEHSRNSDSERSSSESPFSSENATGPTRLGHPNSSKLQTKNKGVGVQQQQQKQQQAGVACEKHTYNKGK